MKLLPPLLLLPVLMLVLAACSSGPSEADINATVEAKVEQAKASLVAPTAEPLQTYTPLPTYTPAPVVVKEVPVEKIVEVVNEVIVEKIVEVERVVVVTATPVPTPTPTQTPISGTQVGGMLKEDTTWGLADSPYLVTETVQIPEDVTLTIEAGVEVALAQGASNMFYIAGILKVEGSQSSLVHLRGWLSEDGGAQVVGGGPLQHHELIDIRFATIKEFYRFVDVKGVVNVHDSVFNNIVAMSSLPNVQVIMKRNRFENAHGFAVGGDVHSFEDNCFVSKNNKEASDSPTWFLLLRTGIRIENNAFLDKGKTAFISHSGDGGTILVGPNYYGTTDRDILDQMVEDRSDDLRYGYHIVLNSILETSPIEGCP